MTRAHKIMKGDTRTPLGGLIDPDGIPTDLAGVTVKAVGYDSSATAWITETETGVTVHPTTNFTVDATDNWLIANGTKVENGMQVVVSTTTTLPGGLAASTRYFVRDATPNRFKVSLIPGGSPVDITSAGSGTHSYYVVGSVQYDFQTADVDTAGRYKLWFRVYTGAEYDTFPNDGDGIPVIIEEVG